MKITLQWRNSNYHWGNILPLEKLILQVVQVQRYMAICQYNCYECHGMFYKMGCTKTMSLRKLQYSKRSLRFRYYSVQ